MPTLLDIAEHAAVSPETVMRVLLREPVSEAVHARVSAAIAELGFPEYPRPDGHIEVLPAEPGRTDRAAPSLPAPAAADGHELARELRSLFAEVVDRLERERRERIDDFALSTELISEGWRTVDRRLGRLEQMIERLNRREQLEREQTPSAEVHRLDEHRHGA